MKNTESEQMQHPWRFFIKPRKKIKKKESMEHYLKFNGEITQLEYYPDQYPTKRHLIKHKGNRLFRQPGCFKLPSLAV